MEKRLLDELLHAFDALLHAVDLVLELGHARLEHLELLACQRLRVLVEVVRRAREHRLEAAEAHLHHLEQGSADVLADGRLVLMAA